MTEQPKDGGAAFDLAQMIADRDAGTQGPWLQGGVLGGGKPTTVYSDDATGSAIADTVFRFVYRTEDECKANALRIARVPVMEAEIIRLTARLSLFEGALHTISGDIQINSDGDEELSDAAHVARAALSTPTEEPKT